MQSLKIEENNTRTSLSTLNTSSDLNENRFFLVRDDTRLMLVDFEGGNSEEISVLPFSDSEVS
jgi:hypothetical protein